MALTPPILIDPTLATAQDSLNRRPIVEITTSQFVSDIPFDGQFLTSTIVNEQKPNVITHSTGRLCLVCLYGTTKFRYIYTDTERQTFTTVEFTLTGGWLVDEISICELADGNIGLIFIITVGSVVRLYRMILSPVGAIQTDFTKIGTDYSTTLYEIKSPWVVQLANGTYFLVYYHKVKGTGVYSIMRRICSADVFITWGSEAAITLTPLTTTLPKRNPSLLQVDDGDLFLWFDYVESSIDGNELTNIYYLLSTDNGVNWVGTPTVVTAYTSPGEVGRHPVACQKDTDEMHLIFNQVTGSLHIDGTTGGYCGPYGALYPTDMVWDSVHRMLYVICSSTSSTRMLQSVIKVDVDNWHIEDCWDCGTTPLFNSAWCSGSGFIYHGRNHGEGSKVPVAITNLSTSPKSIALVDGEADSITFYHFVNSAGYGIVANVTGANVTGLYLVSTWYDESTGRLYAVWITSGRIKIGYIASGTYVWTEIVSETGIGTYDVYGLTTNNGQFIVDNTQGVLIASMGHLNTGSTWTGRLKVYNAAGGGILHDYKTSAYTSFPYHGLYRCCVIGTKIYGSFQYDSGIVGESLKRGLCCIDTATNGITFHRPSWATLDDYALREVVAMEDGRIVCNALGYGVTIFDPASDTWVLFNNDNIAGLTPHGEDNFNYALAYSDDDGYIFTGQASSGNLWNGLVMFSDEGSFQRAYYRLGSKSGTWSFLPAANAMAQGLLDYDLVPALDPIDQSIFAFWTHNAQSELSIKWDKENSEFDLSPYLVKGEEITLKRSVDGDPSSLSFTVSHGHLFDPQNRSSLLSMYLKKFRKINLRFGEKIGGYDYWQQMGVFIVVNGGPINYERPNYPTMKILAEDKLSMWEIHQVTATEFWETDPKTILEDVMITFADLVIGDINFPVFDDTDTLYYQWMDTTIKDILAQVCDRFGYYPRIDIDGKIGARKIARDNPVDHTFTGKNWMKNFTPDDSFSDYTNRVIVIGEGRDYLEVVYAEEPITSIAGSTGWWGGHRHREVWYAEDGSRLCRYPRLEVVESIKEYNFKLGGGGEHIDYVDPSERYVRILIDAPNMIGWLIGLIVAYIVIKAVCSLCDCEYMCGICGVIESIILYVVFYILASVASYQYRIHACPIGYVRQSFQAQADDTELQAMLDAIVESKFTDPFCDTVADCQFVADFELMVAQLQRNRIRMTKLADLRDEDGDTISFLHPHSGLPITMFITNITRKMKIPSSPRSNDGYFLDDIEGWSL